MMLLIFMVIVLWLLHRTWNFSLDILMVDVSQPVNGMLGIHFNNELIFCDTVY